MEISASVIMKKQPNYFLMLSLREIALRRLPVILWNDPAILNMLGKLQFNPGGVGSFMRSLECRVTDKLSNLSLPESLKSQIRPLLDPIGWEILKWLIFHRCCLNQVFDSSILQKLCWTTVGTIDYQKTAEILLCCDAIDVTNRFDLACLYCLENYIFQFWKELPQMNKCKCFEVENEMPDMQLLFPYILKKFFNMSSGMELITDYFHYFRYSALYGNKALVEYCFKKLTKEERDSSLVELANNILNIRNSHSEDVFRVKDDQFSDIIYYLLSVMTPEEQIRIFMEKPYEVLISFLTYQWKDLFLEIADVIWTFLPETKYKRLAQKIFRIIDKKNLNLPNFFQQLFLRSPSNFRKCLVDEECNLCLMSVKFFKRKDTETIKVIFGNIDAADRLRLVSSKTNLNFIYKLSPLEWHIAAEYLEAALLSKKDKKKVKKAFIEHVKSEEKGAIKMKDQRWINLFEFLDETNARAESKRKSEDETSRKILKIG